MTLKTATSAAARGEEAEIVNAAAVVTGNTATVIAAAGCAAVTEVPAGGWAAVPARIPRCGKKWRKCAISSVSFGNSMARSAKARTLRRPR